jgi:hypothetical protein
MIIFKKAIVVLVAAGLGLAAGTVAATPPIAIANSLATDGPYFPAPLVALGFVALPISGFLFVLQLGVAAYEVLTRRALGRALLVIGLVGGLAAGLIWYLMLAASQADWGMQAALGGAGAIQGLCVFGGHWLAGKWRWAEANDDRAAW